MTVLVVLQHTCIIACPNLLICDFARNTNVLGFFLIIEIRLNLIWSHGSILQFKKRDR